MLGRLVSTAATLAAADVLAQGELRDAGRTVRYALAGTVSLVPLFSIWYRFIDRKLDRRYWPIKLVLECVTVGPLYLALLLGNEEMLKSRDGGKAVNAIKEKWTNLYVESLKVVPIYQAVNYAVIPSHLRIYWLNGCQLLWNVYASTILHKT